MKYKIREDILWRTVDGEAVMLDLKEDGYYSLNRQGTEIWQLIEKGESVERIPALLEKKYAGSSEAITRDVKKTVQDLLEKRLIEALS